VDEKKPPDSLAVFRVSVDSRVLPTLSIRQRPEMPKKVKIKLRRGGHDDRVERLAVQKRVKKVIAFITR
jgi:hypothetical protein